MKQKRDVESGNNTESQISVSKKVCKKYQNILLFCCFMMIRFFKASFLGKKKKRQT